MSGHRKDGAQEKAGEMGGTISCWTLWHGEDHGFFRICNGKPLKDLTKKNGTIGCASKCLLCGDLFGEGKDRNAGTR